jgi:hypothetical protein
VLLVLLSTLAVVLTRPAVLRPVSQWVLSTLVGGEVRVDAARWHWPVSVEFTGLTLSPSGSQLQAQVGLRVARVDAALGWAGLRSIALKEPTVRLHDDGHGGVDLVGLSWLLTHGEGDGSQGALPDEGVLSGAQILIERPDEKGQWHIAERLVMNLQWRLDTSRTRWEVSGSATEVSRPDAQPAQLEGWIDRSTGELDVRVENVSLSSPHRAIAPVGLRELWDRLEPQGRFPKVHVRVQRHEQTGKLEVAAAEVELRDVAVTLPLEGLEQPNDLAVSSPDEQARNEADNSGGAASGACGGGGVRMEHVEGRLALVKDRLEITSLSGLIEGLRYRVSGWQELRMDGRGWVSLETEPFELDAHPPWILRLPAVARDAHDQLRPSGRYAAYVVVERQERDGSWTLDGELKLLDAALLLKAFPYPLTNVTGRVLFDENSVTLEKLVAHGPTGGKVGVNGIISEPAGDVIVDVRVDLISVPIDDPLIEAMAPRAQKPVRALFDRDAFAQVERIVKQSTDTDPTHTFRVGGEANGQVHITLDPSMGGHAWVQTTLDAKGLGLVMEEFPYPLTGTGGSVVINEREVLMQDVGMLGPSGATGLLTGKIDRPKEGGVIPLLRIEQIDAPIDAWLRAAMHQRDAQWLEQLGLRGRMTGLANVIPGSKPGKMSYNLSAWLHDATLQPFAGRFTIEQVHGSARIEKGLIRLEGITGRRGGGTLSVSGDLRTNPETKATTLNLAGQATALPVEPAWADLFPPGSELRDRLTHLFEQYQPGGQVAVRFDARGDLHDAPEADADADTSKPNPDAALRTTLIVEPETLRARYRDQDLLLENMAGTIDVRDDHLKLHRVRGEMEHGWLELDGVVAIESDGNTALTLKAESTFDCPVTLAILPGAASQSIQALDLKGRYALDDGRLLHRQGDDQAPRLTEFDAQVRLIDASARLGVLLEKIDGQMLIGVRDDETSEVPTLSMQLRVPTLLAAGRSVESLEATATNRTQPGWLALTWLQARLYGGSLTGSGGVALVGEPRYKVDLALQEAALGPVIDPKSVQPKSFVQTDPVQQASATQPGEPSMEPGEVPLGQAGMLDRKTDTGLVSASLAIEADYRNPQSRLGRGEVTFRDASLFDRPLASAVLRSINFALPTTRPLDHGRAKFLLEADTVRFEELRLAGPGLSFVGAGTMTLPDATLNLALFTRNQAAPDLGPLSKLIDAFKDELVAIHVTSTLAEPKSQLSTLGGLRQAVNELVRQMPQPLERTQPTTGVIEPNSQ